MITVRQRPDPITPNLKTHMKTISQLLVMSTLSTQAAVVWQAAPNAVASASWDVWSYAPPVGQTGSGSQGPAQETGGSLITTSDLETSVIDAYEFPGGLGTNPDTYYFHTGGAEWTGSLSLSEGVSHVRVSYSLLGFGGAPPEDFPVTPNITGANSLGRGHYASDDGLILGTVFYQDFALAAPQTEIETTFGDIVFPGYPGSFRSVDGVRMEVFQAAPIPEPSAGVLALLGAAMLRRRRNRLSQ